MSEECYIRSRPFTGGQRLKVCEHIFLKDVEPFTHRDDCEYVQPLNVFCSVCQKQFTLKLLVN